MLVAEEFTHRRDAEYTEAAQSISTAPPQSNHYNCRGPETLTPSLCSAQNAPHHESSQISFTRIPQAK